MVFGPLTRPSQHPSEHGRTRQVRDPFCCCGSKLGAGSNFESHEPGWLTSVCSARKFKNRCPTSRARKIVSRQHQSHDASEGHVSASWPSGREIWWMQVIQAPSPSGGRGFWLTSSPSGVASCVCVERAQTSFTGFRCAPLGSRPVARRSWLAAGDGWRISATAPGVVAVGLVGGPCAIERQRRARERFGDTALSDSGHILSVLSGWRQHLWQTAFHSIWQEHAADQVAWGGAPRFCRVVGRGFRLHSRTSVCVVRAPAPLSGRWVPTEAVPLRALATFLSDQPCF